VNPCAISLERYKRHKGELESVSRLASERALPTSVQDGLKAMRLPELCARESASIGAIGQCNCNLES